MTNEMTAFPFQAGDVNQNVRVVPIDGAPWFVAADVCRALGRGNPSMALRLLGADEKTLIRNEAYSASSR